MGVQTTSVHATPLIFLGVPHRLLTNDNVRKTQSPVQALKHFTPNDLRQKRERPAIITK